VCGCPTIGTFAQSGRGGRVGTFAQFTTTYTDTNGYEDIDLALFLLGRQPPITGGGLAAAYYGPANLQMLLGGSTCQPGDSQFLTTGYVMLSCAHTSVSGTGDALTVSWVARPEQCFEGSCGWNWAAEFVTDSAGLQDAGLVGWWRLVGSAGQGRYSERLAKSTRVDDPTARGSGSTELAEVLEQLRKEIEA
jgi:hypothetical protein